MRLVIESNIEAAALAVKFSNVYGDNPLPIGAASLALCEASGELYPGTLVPLTVGGFSSFEIPPQGDIFSDTIPFPLSPGQYFALNIYYPTNERVVSGNWLGTGAQRSRPGNYSADLKLPGPSLVSRFARTVIVTDLTVSITSVSEIVAYGDKPHRVLACFGDSITQQCNWTTPFSKLLYHRYPGEITLCNLGISGNRLSGGSPTALGGLYGQAGAERFERDMLSLHGLTHAILALGANDIGLPGSNGVPLVELITLEQYAPVMASFAHRLHERNVKVIAATITPRSLSKPYDEAREILRREINDWIRSAPCFDSVLDFDNVLQRTDGAPGMKDNYALPDGLHPSPYGGLWMAKFIDLSLFGSDTNDSNG